jgi:hypothetical protein
LKCIFEIIRILTNLDKVKIESLSRKDDTDEESFWSRRKNGCFARTFMAEVSGPRPKAVRVREVANGVCRSAILTLVWRELEFVASKGRS